MSVTSQQLNAEQQLHTIETRIRAAETKYGRKPHSVTLVGASKQQNAEWLSKFVNLGLQHTGENYLQEGIAKQASVRDMAPDALLSWHFIGHVQSNKTKLIAEHFSWVHGVDRLKIADRLARQNTQMMPIKLLLQLNIDDEDSKAGVTPSEAASLADQITQSLSTPTPGQGAQLVGFMAIPKARDSLAEQRAVFAQARELMVSTNQRYGLNLTQLSMGMSGDLEAAIAEGATLVRVGSSLFGARD